MSGNGIRCFAKHVIEELGAPRDMLTIETLAGLHEITPRFESGQVVAARVGMGAPRFDPAQIPVTARGVERVIDYPLQVGETSLRITSLSMGNPHAVAFIDEPVESWPLERVGPLVERDPFFPRRVNFEIVNVESPQRLRARVWERGASETLGVRQRGLRRSRRGPDQGPGGRVRHGEPPRRRAEDRLGRRGGSLARRPRRPRVLRRLAAVGGGPLSNLLRRDPGLSRGWQASMALGGCFGAPHFNPLLLETFA